MPETDARHINRDSLFLMATVQVEGRRDESRVKIRNLSVGGMMAEGEVKVMRGERLCIDLRNIGWIEGSVAWVQDNRFGIAFATEIDPRAVRGAPVVTTALPKPDFLRRAYVEASRKQEAAGPLRKV